MVLSNVSPFLGGGYEFSGVTERTAEENRWISYEDLRESHYVETYSITSSFRSQLPKREERKDKKKRR
ncbi:hypothetical protein PROFUN_10261 [Planoprotostelium fungivorum]|uniref:Uncharacterized protein n=1 Tax=Planoprotostelium fungivorum TaxID=1890364 RepID=A0A2P6NEH2_9EUKA|nr:hypothetical protein PROFUN_10261 [Planoprotostelium fungivorum]